MAHQASTMVYYKASASGLLGETIKSLAEGPRLAAMLHLMENEDSFIVHYSEIIAAHVAELNSDAVLVWMKPGKSARSMYLNVCLIGNVYCIKILSAFLFLVVVFLACPVKLSNYLQAMT